MQLTKAFRNGNSLAGRIRPARRSLAGAMDAFARFSPDFMKNGRGQQGQKERQVL